MMRALIVFSIFLSFQLAFARLEFDDHVMPEFVTSARALAIGNAYISKVDDSWSAFYNPAGLGTVRKARFHIANFHSELNKSSLDGLSSDDTGDIPTNFLASLPATTQYNQLQKAGFGVSHNKINWFPNITFRNFTLGWFYSKINRMRAIDALSDVEVSRRKDRGPVFSFNFSLLGGIVKIGVSTVYLHREESIQDFMNGAGLDIENFVKEAHMLHVTTGTRITLPYKFLPTFSLVGRNINSGSWTNEAGLGAPDDIPTTFDTGVSITPQIGRIVRLHFEAVVRDITNEYKRPSHRRLGYGMEIDIRRRMFVRFGYGDGWGSGGIGVRGRSFVMDFTTYAVENSRENTKFDEDRRFVVNFSYGL